MKAIHSGRYRSSSGNILTIAAITGVIVLIIALWAIDAFWLHFLSKKEMSAAEKVAMAAAVALNKDDNIGQMNFMLARSRELIYCMRYDEAMAEAKGYKDILQLSKGIAQKAHDNASLLSRERQKLATLRIEESVAAAKAAVNSAGSPGSAHMAGISTSGASLNIDASCFGCLSKNASGSADPHANINPDNVSPSNVEPSRFSVLENGGKELDEYDKQFIDTSSKLYKGNCILGMNPPFGGDDTDLELKISSLPPCLNGYIAAPRLVQASEFQFMAPLTQVAQPRFIPTAVYVVLQLDVKDTNSGSTNQLMAPGVAVTTGAGPDP